MAQPKHKQSKRAQPRTETSQPHKDGLEEGKTHRQPNPIEWAVGAVSSLLVLAIH